jgi:hypothetical protein
MKSIGVILSLLVLSFFSHAESMQASEAECQPKATPHEHRGVDVVVGSENLSKDRARACRRLVADPAYRSIKIFLICNDVAELSKSKSIHPNQAAEALKACDTYFSTNSVSLFHHKGKNCILSTQYAMGTRKDGNDKPVITYTLNDHRTSIVYNTNTSNSAVKIANFIKDQCIK